MELTFHDKGAFFYKTDNQETDIEILSADLASGVHYTNQNLIAGPREQYPSTHVAKPLPGDASKRYHEYRLDWVQGKTTYYVDGVLQQTHTTNVPTMAGTWLWNNWR